MSAEENLVIVGASLTGAKAAEAIRQTGFDGKVVLLGSEAQPPYERPPLSKDYMRGEADGKPFVFDDDFYAERDVELHTGANVTAIDPETSTVAVDGSPEVRFDRLLIATGAEPRLLPLPGADLDGIVYLRTIEDSDTLGKQLGEGTAQGKPREEILYFDADPSWELEVAGFLDNVLNDTPVESGNSEQALKAMRLVYEIYGNDETFMKSKSAPIME